jgi:hypothetical protein
MARKYVGTRLHSTLPSFLILCAIQQIRRTICVTKSGADDGSSIDKLSSGSGLGGEWVSEPLLPLSKSVDAKHYVATAKKVFVLFTGFACGRPQYEYLSIL